MIFSSIRGFFYVSAKLEPHGRKEFVLKIGVTARTKSFIQRRGEYRYRNAFIDSGLDSPSPFT
jgi:hypothetical protein